MEDENNEISISEEEYYERMTERWAGEIGAVTRYDLDIEDLYRKMAEIIGYKLDESASDENDSGQKMTPGKV